GRVEPDLGAGERAIHVARLAVEAALPAFVLERVSAQVRFEAGFVWLVGQVPARRCAGQSAAGPGLGRGHAADELALFDDDHPVGGDVPELDRSEVRALGRPAENLAVTHAGPDDVRRI